MDRLTKVLILNVIVMLAIGYGGYYFFFRPEPPKEPETQTKASPKTNLNGAQTLSEAESVVHLSASGLAVRFPSAAAPERM